MRRGDRGVYLVGFRVDRRAQVRVGALGTFRLAPGTYVYVGSARRGLQARLARHLSAKRAHRWHVDYLGRAARPAFLVVLPWGAGRECRVAKGLLGVDGASLPIGRFGSSDCRCPAHMVYFAREPRRGFWRSLDGGGRGRSLAVEGGGRDHDEGQREG